MTKSSQSFFQLLKHGVLNTKRETSEKDSPRRELGAAIQEGGGSLLLISAIFARFRSSFEISSYRPRASSIKGSQAFPGVRQTVEKEIVNIFA